MLCTLPVQAAGFEQTFKEAQAAYKTGKYADAARLFVQTADLLKKAKETAKAQMVLAMQPSPTCRLKITLLPSQFMKTF